MIELQKSSKMLQQKQGLKLNVEDLPELIEPAWVKTMTKLNILSAFKSTGIWPYNKNWVENNLVKFKTSHLISSSKDINKFDKLGDFINKHKILRQDSKALNSLNLAVIERLPLKEHYLKNKII